ncbi:hypothetical protein amrb99_12710 [Actinomadura sp. RB99]|uniref:hypothetical protein n=1 Tax=Actinomadura sp. RB99 TaxID=2691577 RepID=UPI00168955BE|nr:hypothetical protein [Actinomadura sp. RB99]MBD2892361.1 hypothetical protein [Actinomadura sp. RB99]
MGLRARLLRFATARPPVFLITSPGGARARLLIEAELRRRGGRIAASPAAAAILVVCGRPGPELADAVNVVWNEMPGPRSRVRLDGTASDAEVTAELDRATAELADVAVQSADAEERRAQGPWSPSGGDEMAEHGEHMSGGHQHGHMPSSGSDDHGSMGHGGEGHDMDHDHAEHSQHSGQGEGLSAAAADEDEPMNHGGGHAGHGAMHGQSHDGSEHSGHSSASSSKHEKAAAHDEHTGHGHVQHTGHSEGPPLEESGDEDHGEHLNHGGGHAGHGGGHGGHGGGHAGHSGHGGGHGGHDHHMGAPMGLAMADRMDDRDGLKLDVLHIPLGPALKDWPAGLVLRLAVQGDVVQAAQVAVAGGADEVSPFWDEPRRRAAAGEQVTVGEAERRRAAHRLDSVSRLLSVAGWESGADQARALRDQVLAGKSTSEAAPRFTKFASRARKARILRWMLKGVGEVDQAVADRHGLEAGQVGDASARLAGWLDEIGEAIVQMDESAYLDGTSVPARGRAAEAVLAALPELLAGAELAAARLTVASLDPDLEQLAMPAGVADE